MTVKRSRTIYNCYRNRATTPTSFCNRCPTEPPKYRNVKAISMKQKTPTRHLLIISHKAEGHGYWQPIAS